ncbi:MAG TPA: dipeptidase [Planctomycetota bacterium]|nr:dipeptidase [Planctomycetota bacterium]
MSDKSTSKLHHSSFIVDGHADTFWRMAMKANPPARPGTAKYKYFRNTPDFFTGIPPTKPGQMARSHTDFQRLKMGGTSLQFMAAYTPPSYTGLEATTYALRMVFEILHGVRSSTVLASEARQSNKLRLLRSSRGDSLAMTPRQTTPIEPITLVKSADDLTDLVRRDGMGFLINIEGGNPLNKDIGMIKVFYDLGVRSLGLTHSVRNDLGDGIHVKNPKGLTPFGKSVVKELNRLNMLIDVAHLAKPGFNDVARIAQGPIISSHTGIRRLRDITRNLDDEQIKEIARRKGVIGIMYLPEFIIGGTLSYQEIAKQKLICRPRDVVDHIAYVADKFGVDYVGLGSDWDGYNGVTHGLEDCSYLPNLTVELVRRGFNQAEIRKILGGNFVRVIKQVLR